MDCGCPRPIPATSLRQAGANAAYTIFGNLTVKIAAGVALLSLVICAAAGASVGLITAREPMFSDPNLGAVPAHRCILARGTFCGLYSDGGSRMIEVSASAPAAQFTPISTGRKLLWYPERRRLSPAQVTTARASRAGLFRSALYAGTSEGARVGTVFWFWAGLTGLVLTSARLFWHSVTPLARAIAQGAWIGLATLFALLQRSWQRMAGQDERAARADDLPLGETQHS